MQSRMKRSGKIDSETCVKFSTRRKYVSIPVNFRLLIEGSSMDFESTILDMWHPGKSYHLAGQGTLKGVARNLAPWEEMFVGLHSERSHID